MCVSSLMNGGSPYNVSPGSQADLSAVVAHYKRQNQEMEEARVARMKDGKVVSVYDVDRTTPLDDLRK